MIVILFSRDKPLELQMFKIDLILLTFYWQLKMFFLFTYRDCDVQISNRI